MGQADRIRRLAARALEPEDIAERLEVRPAVVRRVLGRSAQRGAPRTRGVSAPLSFVTTVEVAEKVRAKAAKRGVSVSIVLDELVRQALHRPKTGAKSGGRRSLSGASKVEEALPSGSPSGLETAADAPEAVSKLLKSYDPKDLSWESMDHRHLIVVAILTRGNSEAKKWLWSVLSREDVRELVRRYGGAGCAEPERAQLREQLGLTTTDIPPRAYLGMERGGGRDPRS